jgi:hypothetical protein
MRTLIAGLATVLALSATATADQEVLYTSGTYALGTVTGQSTHCSSFCRLAFEVREGERYLHLNTSAPTGGVLVEVRTGTGVVRVCQNTKHGALYIEPFRTVHVEAVLDNLSCGPGPAPVGTVTAYFSKHEILWGDAIANGTPDPARRVHGGI